jgi:hypothetical protein
MSNFLAEQSICETSILDLSGLFKAKLGWELHMGREVKGRTLGLSMFNNMTFVYISWRTMELVKYI